MRNLENQGNQLPSEVVVLDAGKLVEQGSPSDLLTPDDGRTGLPAGFCDVEVLAEMGFSHCFPMVFTWFSHVTDLETDPMHPEHSAA